MAGDPDIELLIYDSVIESLGYESRLGCGRRWLESAGLFLQSAQNLGLSAAKTRAAEEFCHGAAGRPPRIDADQPEDTLLDPWRGMHAQDRLELLVP